MFVRVTPVISNSNSIHSTGEVPTFRTVLVVPGRLPCEIAAIEVQFMVGFSPCAFHNISTLLHDSYPRCRLCNSGSGLAGLKH